MDVRIELEKVRPEASGPKSNSETRYRVRFEGREIGIWRDPEHSAARWLVDQGLAKREDRLRVVHDGVPASRGSMAWFADHRIEENDRQGLRVVKWRPNPFATGGRTPEKTASDGPEAPE